MRYCESIFQTKRRRTREVLVGSVGIGGNHPIRIQSMTTSNTRDVALTIEQIMRLSDEGCEIARVTVQGMKEADACEGIKNGLLQRGYTIPLVADIHFFPPAAIRAVDFVEKVRINPGNYADKRASFKTIEFDDASYSRELERIEEKFTPLVEKCRTLKRAMRIGTNHGSLSDRIMSRYGDTARGMLESALEFAHICRKNDFHNFVFSMKSSNPRVMIQAYRLLVAEMYALGWDYPLHVGVTEAGEGEDGRIKSAMGIGALLLDGIGETIRVSLTEDAWREIDPCRRLIALARSYEGLGVMPFEELYRQVESNTRRSSLLPRNLSLHRDGSVIVAANPSQIASAGFYQELGCDVQMGFPKLAISSADAIVLTTAVHGGSERAALQQLKQIGISMFAPTSLDGEIPLLSLHAAGRQAKELSVKAPFAPPLSTALPLAIIIGEEDPSEWEALLELKPEIIFLSPAKSRLHYSRLFFDWLQRRKLSTPVILRFQYGCAKEDLIIHAAAEFGGLLCDGLGDGICIDAPFELDFLRRLSFNILQAARMRRSKTDFISCPSCGRTLFDLQEVSKKIRARTSHLPGVKIAIMGCIVNGPGEMADADFGYVGSRPGMIDLYVGKECVEKNIDFAAADDRLVALIKKEGRWIEPASAST